MGGGARGASLSLRQPIELVGRKPVRSLEGDCEKPFRITHITLGLHISVDISFISPLSSE